MWLTGLTSRAFTRDHMTPHLDDYRCCAEVRASFQETAPRKTAENTAKHRDGGVGLVVANQRGGSESLVVVTTRVFCLVSFVCISVCLYEDCARHFE